MVDEKEKVKNISPNVYLFHGLDSFSSKNALNTWKNGFLKKYGDNADIEEHYGKKADIKGLTLNINSLPFLCDKRMIIVYDFFATRTTDELRELGGIIENVQEDTLLVFYENKNAPKNLVLYKRIAKFGEVKEFKSFSIGEGVKLIQTTAESNGTTVDRPTAEYLFNYLDGQAWNISNETKKLSTFSEVITKKIINENVTEALNSSIFKLTDALSGKSLRKSLSVLQTLLASGDSPMQIFFMIARNFRIIVQVKELAESGLNKNEIAKELKLKPFVAMQAMRPARNFTFDELKAIYKALIDIEVKLKTGGIKVSVGNQTNYVLAIEMLIIEMCK